MFFRQGQSREIIAKRIKKLSPTVQYFIVRINNNNDPDHPELKDYYSAASSHVYKLSEKSSLNAADRYFQAAHSNSRYIYHGNRKEFLKTYEKEAIEYVQSKYKEYIKIKKPLPTQIAPPVVTPKNKCCFWNKTTCQIVGVAATGIVAATALYSMLNK